MPPKSVDCQSFHKIHERDIFLDAPVIGPSTEFSLSIFMLIHLYLCQIKIYSNLTTIIFFFEKTELHPELWNEKYFLSDNILYEPKAQP